MSCSLFDVFSSGPKTRKRSMFNFITSLRKAPRGRVFSASICPGLSIFRPYPRKSGIRNALRRSPPLACGLALIRRVPVGASSLRSHPLFEHLQLLGVFLHVRHRYLVRTPRTLQPVAADLRRSSPALWGTQHNHWPADTPGNTRRSSFLLTLPDLGNALLDGRRHRLVHALGVGALHKIGRPAVTPEQVLYFLVGDASQQSRVVDLVTVEMKNREHRAVANGVQELADVPGGRQRTSFRLPISDYRRHDQAGIVEGSAAGMREDIPELASLMDRARRFRSTVTADAARKRELLEELLQPGRILALLGVNLGVGTLQVHRAQDTWSTVPRTSQEDHVQVVFFDQSVQVNVNKCQARARPPVSEKPIFDVLRLEGFLQEGIVLQVDHPKAQVIAGPPVGMDFLQRLGA